MHEPRRLRLQDWLPEWLLTACCCGELDDDDPDSSLGTLPLRGSSATYAHPRGEPRREGEGEALLDKASERSDNSASRQHTARSDASTSGAGRREPAVEKPRAAPLTMKTSRSSERCKALEDRRFSSLPVPSYAADPWRGPPDIYDEEVCAICLEEYEDANPRNFLTCGHAFHLGCILEWEERGHDICPLCDVAVASHLGDEEPATAAPPRRVPSSAPADSLSRQ